ncbi:hypothetical protein Acr_28g0004720 [Actinidia rufa]|uniref:Retrovirus-related Pol polyprotein from transposon TNT 1-94-like beta-barrel domain-containing protein n=1 Tax=Actinidia rufa TaxID=165716 RepID=A0A7J0H9I7_9ERIC|nr:hypothetical protein Acr_28g0004720 [Actinidia rufa]
MIGNESDVLLPASTDGKLDWILDLESAYHLCGDKEIFSTYAAYDGELVRMANNTTSIVVGTGAAQFRMADERSLTLTKVSHAAFLRARKLWKYITGDAQPSHFSETDDDDALHIQYQSQLEDWDSVNSKIITWFSNTSVSSIHSLFTPFETAKEVWDYLAEQYSLVDGANEYQLGLELHHLRFDLGQTLTDFYKKLSNLWNHLVQFEPTWTCPTNAAAFYAYRDRSRLRHFLTALPPDYEYIRASLLHRHPLSTVGQALAELRSKETRKKTMKKYCSFCRRDTHSYEDCRSRSKSKCKGYHNRQTAAVTDSSGPSSDSSSSTLTAANVETIVTQVLSRTNLHSSTLSTTSGSADEKNHWDRP